MEIKSLENIELPIIYKAFNEAFEDYEMHWSEIQFNTMLKRRGFVAKLSFGAFQENTLVAFILNATGTFNGKSTVYDTGTGTIKAYRGQGLISKIFEYSVPFFKDEKIEQYLLEVLQHNDKAISIYKKAGFKVNRELNYFRDHVELINIETAVNQAQFEIKRIELETIKTTEYFLDFYPSWQNNFDSIHRAKEDFVIIGVYDNERIIGYCIIEPLSGDIPQIAVAHEYRKKKIGSYLLKEVMKYNKVDTIKIINADERDSTFTAFLNSKNILVKGKQFEMIKVL